MVLQKFPNCKSPKHLKSSEKTMKSHWEVLGQRAAVLMSGPHTGDRSHYPLSEGTSPHLYLMTTQEQWNPLFKDPLPEGRFGQRGPIKAIRINKASPPVSAATRKYQEQTAEIFLRKELPTFLLKGLVSRDKGYSHSSPHHPWSSSGLPCLPAAVCSASRTPPWPPGPPRGPGPGTGLWFLSLWPLLQHGLALQHSEQICSSLLLRAVCRGNRKY